MATLNTILSISESVGINDQRFIGQMMSRNQRISTSEIIGVQPFGFDMKPMNYLFYAVVLLPFYKMFFYSPTPFTKTLP